MKQLFLAGLGLALASIFTTAAHAELPNEANYPNRNEVVIDGVRTVVGFDLFTVNVETDTLGGYLGVENTSPDTVTIPNPGGVSPMFGWQVRPPGCLPGDDDFACGPVYYSPVVVYFFGTPLRLLPGEVFEVEHAWPQPNGTGPFASGIYTGFGGFGPYAYHYPPGGVAVAVEIVGVPVPVESATWGELKRRFGND